MGRRNPVDKQDRGVTEKGPQKEEGDQRFKRVPKGEKNCWTNETQGQRQKVGCSKSQFLENQSRNDIREHLTDSCNNYVRENISLEIL